MLFYKIEARYEYVENVDYQEEGTGIRRRRSREQNVYRLFEDSCMDMLPKKENEKKSLVFLGSVKPKSLIFGAIYSENADIEMDVLRYVGATSITIRDIKISEVTFNMIKGLVDSSCRYNVLPDSEEIFDCLGMECFSERRGRDFIRVKSEEFVLENIRGKRELERAACRILAKETLLPEIGRIFVGTPQKACGHPVHYLIRESDRECSREIRLILQEALYQTGRIQNKRYIIATFSPDSETSVECIENLYMKNKGGMVVIRYTDDDEDEGSYRRPGGGTIIKICDMAIKYRRDVLTILSIPSESEKVKSQFFENLVNMSFVELHSDVVFDDAAKAYLMGKSKEAGIRADKGLYGSIESGEGMHIKDLNTVFDRWYDSKIKRTMFPQYRQVQPVRETLKSKKAKGSALDDLEKMVGLPEAKELIKTALNYYKFQKIYSDMGIQKDRPAMHMVFTGNPGTAKTTVARLFASIMKDNGLLSVGDLYEVGRADIVGKYVGHTAPLVKSKFRAARGSVLFIDEAYSLLDEKEGLYGDEAINAIVQEMENNRDNMVVILAGYPDKMEYFLERNPGLRSRIGFHVHFNDYDADELCQIAEMIAISKGNILTDAAIDKLREVFNEVRLQEDFGNGRYVRNLIEHAKMEQANRIMRRDIKDVNKKILCTLEAEDFVIPKKNHKVTLPMGFAM